MSSLDGRQSFFTATQRPRIIEMVFVEPTNMPTSVPAWCARGQLIFIVRVEEKPKGLDNPSNPPCLA